MKNFNEVLNDPSFVLGASILGNSGQPGVVGAALGNMARINELKSQADFQRRKAEQDAIQTQINQQQLEHQRELLGFNRQKFSSELEESKAERALKQQDMQRKTAAARRQQAVQEAFLRQAAPLLGLPMDAMPQYEDGEDGQDATDIIQPTNLMHNMPPGGALNTAPQPMAMGELGAGAFMNRMPQPQEGMAAPQPMQNFNPDAPGPVGPFQFGNRFGAPAVKGNRMKKTSGGAQAPGRSFGTPSAILDNLMQVESSGNPLAINPTSGAMGAYQFMPNTVSMLRKQGMAFNPFDAQQARQAADFYLSQLVSQHGGDWNKALAAYGGFKDKDPTKYVSRVLQGVNAPPAQQSGVQGPPQPHGGMNLVKLGAMAELAGLKGGSALQIAGKAMEPQTVPAGSYQRQPDGRMEFVGDPYREQSLANDTARLGLDQQRVGMDQQRLGLEGQRVANDTQRTQTDTAKAQQDIATKQRERSSAQATDANLLNGINLNMRRMEQSVDNLLKHPGLKYNTGVAGAIGINKIPGTPGRDAAAELETLKSKLVVDTMTALRQASTNGSTGFGQQSDKEGQRLETMIANLDSAQSEEAVRKQLAKIKQFARESSAAAANRYKSIYGQVPAASGGSGGGIRFLGWEK